MDTRNLFLFFSLIVAFCFSLFTIGCEAGSDTTTGPDSSGVTDTGNPGDDTATPDDTGQPDDNGEKPDSPDQPDTPVAGCDGGTVELTRDGETECVSAEFAEAAEFIEGKEFFSIEPDDGQTGILHIRHVSVSLDMEDDCDGFSKFFLEGLEPIRRVCVDENLQISKCEGNPQLCINDNTITGEITYPGSPTVTIRISDCTQYGCGEYIFGLLTN